MDLQRFAQERTEAATPRRLEEARRRGRVFKSAEAVTAAGLLAAFAALQVTGPWIWQQLGGFARRQWGGMSGFAWHGEAVRELALDILITVLLAAGPVLLAAAAAGLVANYVQVGFLLSLHPLVPDLQRINPLSGLVRLFSRRSLIEALKTTAKLALIGYVAYGAVASARAGLPALLHGTPAGLLATAAAAAVAVVWRMGLALLLLAGLDYAYQRFEYHQSLRMTRREVKDELRDTEGSPELRQRIRRLQKEMSRRRMMAAVPRADVVVTNPTHFAVALRYESDQMAAPVVVAKGQGYLARRIREVAAAHGVPVVEDPPLARTLHAAVEVGDPVPPDLYQAVAEILAYVYRLQGRV